MAFEIVVARIYKQLWMRWWCQELFVLNCCLSLQLGNRAVTHLHLLGRWQLLRLRWLLLCLYSTRLSSYVVDLDQRLVTCNCLRINSRILDINLDVV